MERYYPFRGRESLNHTGAYLFFTKREREVGHIQLVVGHCNENKRQLYILQESVFIWFTASLTNNQMKAHNYLEDIPNLKAKKGSHRHIGGIIKHVTVVLSSISLVPRFGSLDPNFKPKEEAITCTKLFDKTNYH